MNMDMYNYNDAVRFGTVLGTLAGFLIVFVIIGLIALIFYAIVYWKLFKKANQPGWAAIVPIYNTIVMIKMVKMPLWWLAVIFGPYVLGSISTSLSSIASLGLLVFSIFFSLNLAKVFGKDTTFGVLTIFFGWITIPMLAFGSAKYDESAISEGTINSNNNTQQPTNPVTNNQPQNENIPNQTITTNDINNMMNEQQNNQNINNNN